MLEYSTYHAQGDRFHVTMLKLDCLCDAQNPYLRLHDSYDAKNTEK